MFDGWQLPLQVIRINLTSCAPCNRVKLPGHLARTDVPDVVVSLQVFSSCFSKLPESSCSAVAIQRRRAPLPVLQYTRNQA